MYVSIYFTLLRGGEEVESPQQIAPFVDKHVLGWNQCQTQEKRLLHIPSNSHSLSLSLFLEQTDSYKYKNRL